MQEMSKFLIRKVESKTELLVSFVNFLRDVLGNIRGNELRLKIYFYLLRKFRLLFCLRACRLTLFLLYFLLFLFNIDLFLFVIYRSLGFHLFLLNYNCLSKIEFIQNLLLLSLMSRTPNGLDFS